jgi:hypothetical protein
MGTLRPLCKGRVYATIRPNHKGFDIMALFMQ